MTRKIPPAEALAARERALATIAGTYAAPPPVKAKSTSRFMGRVSPRTLDATELPRSHKRRPPSDYAVAMRGKDGQRQ